MNKMRKHDETTISSLNASRIQRWEAKTYTLFGRDTTTKPKGLSKGEPLPYDYYYDEEKRCVGYRDEDGVFHEYNVNDVEVY